MVIELKSSASLAKYTGKATCLDLAINYDDMEYDELSLKPDNAISGEIVFPENEIKYIEIIN
ncbi:hypothetical protein [Streptococcus sp. S784/96/1]|uniref:hypothetical protein n=1 Tax=Streptococcus sp. S784/96/1 TaxID=2653499 RepID=UPI001EE3F3F9|nr:hypothetical protein [Streptococcus sp. S784/96/1]